MTDYEDYNNLAFPPQELSEVDILRAENKALQEDDSTICKKKELDGMTNHITGIGWKMTEENVVKQNCKHCGKVKI